MLKKSYLACVLLAWSGASFSGAMGESNYSPFKWGHFVIQGGGFWTHEGKRQHIDMLGLIGDEFSVTSNNNGSGLVGLGYYINGQQFNSFSMSYGINAFYLAQTTVSGDVALENLFSDLAYRYNITNYPLYAIAKATINTSSPRFAVTVDAGIGPNFMNLGGFEERSLDGITLPDHIFSGHTVTTFSATAGAGIQLNDVFWNRPLECGYRFYYLGQGNLQRDSTQVLDSLNTGTVYANALTCTVTI